MSKKEKNTDKEIVFINPLANFKKPKQRMSREDIEAINLELRKANAEVVKTEHETEIETQNIFIDGFVV